MPTNNITFKDFFFDRALVIRAMDKKTHEALSKSGNFIKRVAQTSMRYRKKANASAAGEPPSAHKDTKRGPLLRKFLFNAYDPSTKSQLIGPQGLGKATAPLVEEVGGTVNVLRFPPSVRTKSASPLQAAAFRRKVLAGEIVVVRSQRSQEQVKYPARPYMKPSFDKELARLPQRWDGELRYG